MSSPPGRRGRSRITSLRSARKPIWEESDPDRIRIGGVATDPLERGRYLVNAMLCPLCHTPISAATGAYDTERFLAGGMRIAAYPWGVWYSRNLTSDPQTGLGRWSDDEIVTAVTRGIARDGRQLDPMAMPWPWFSRLTATDARAIATYLRSLPPARNAVPRTEHVSMPEAVGGKLMALAGAEVGVEFRGGNAAADPSLAIAALAPRGRRLSAALIGCGALATALLCLATALRRRRRALWLTAGLAVLASWLALAVWPPLRLMSPEVTTRWLFAGTPRLPETLAGAPRALVERGEYVATVAPCGLCHTPARAFVGFDTRRTLAGGMEARWRVYGTAVSTNLTGHPRDGIRDTSDPALVRALRERHWGGRPSDALAGHAVGYRLAMVTRGPARPDRVPSVATAVAGTRAAPAWLAPRRSGRRHLLLRRRHPPLAQ